MTTAKITAGGQISIPAAIRRRWGTSTLLLEDFGDRIVLTPMPDDPEAVEDHLRAGQEVQFFRNMRRADAS